MVLPSLHVLQSPAQSGRLKRRRLCLGGLVIGTLSGAILGTAVPAFSAQTDVSGVKQALHGSDQEIQGVSFGVAIADDSDEVQTSIAARLNQLNQPFVSVEWERVNRLNDLEGIDVLFLPSVKTVTSRQVRVLSEWLDQGGQLIVSGPLGESSPSNVQAQLRSLLGAYWAFALPHPSSLRVRDRHPLADAMTDTPAIAGGIIVPTGLDSRTIATWQTSTEVSVQGTGNDGISRRVNVGSAGAPAIVATERATFLGWNWGHPGSPDVAFDVAWLESVLPSDHTASRTAPRGESHTTAPSRPPALQLPAQSSSTPSNPSNSPETTAIAPSLPLTPGSDDEFVDPTQQIAPAGLEVQQTAQPIHILERIAMAQELENLIGRFESALLASQLYGGDRDNVTNQPPSILLASTSNQPGIASDLANSSEESSPARVLDHPALVEANAILDAFPHLVNQRRYGEARQQWLEARQLLWDNFPTDRPIAQPEVRAIWLDRGTIVEAGSRQRLADIFDQLARAGINTVFVETVNAGYPIYPSRVAPEQNPLIRNWDPLAAAVDLAHERGMEAHAWVWVFAAGNQRHNVIANLPWNYPGPILAANPGWANADRQGRAIPIGQDKPFLDPANPEVRQYLLRLYEEIVTQYDVDGLHLDYIRYPFQNAASGHSYGYGAASRQQFQRLTGADPLTLTPGDRALWQQWTDFRTEQVNSFVSEVADLLDQTRPDIVLSAAVFAMSEHERVQKLQQHWEVWTREGDIDMIVTMSYASDTNRFQQLTSPWLLEADLGSTLIVPGIQLFNLSEIATLDQIQALRDTPAGGYALFAVEHLNADLSAILNRTQGNHDIPLAPVPFRDPFRVASVRFNALHDEWNLMLDSGALWMRESQRVELEAASEELQGRLDALSDGASPQDIRHAQEALEQFTDRFEDWMYLQSLNHSYRVRIWQNRLTMIDTLLSYGGDRLQ